MEERVAIATLLASPERQYDRELLVDLLVRIAEYGDSPAKFMALGWLAKQRYLVSRDSV